jgi:hypothetical protein
MHPKVPETLKKEHKALHKKLQNAIDEEGEVGAAAMEVKRLLHPHFLREEEFALPPLGLLGPISQGKPADEPAKVIKMTDRLKLELPSMLEEHRQIVAALEKLKEVANELGKTRHLRFAKKLKLHAQNEEEVLYPAAILVGEYLKAKAA